MTCAKKQIRCTITALNGTSISGTNWCGSPQEVCPRLPGENYDKCRSICQQAGHAEVVAIEAARRNNVNLKGAIAVVSGHYHVCEPCAAALRDAGINEIIIHVE